MRVCAHYTCLRERPGRALDPVANFHLSNGAFLERLNWLGDVSAKGMQRSRGMMVNYRLQSSRHRSESRSIPDER